MPGRRLGRRLDFVVHVRAAVSIMMAHRRQFDLLVLSFVGRCLANLRALLVQRAVVVETHGTVLLHRNLNWHLDATRVDNRW